MSNVGEYCYVPPNLDELWKNAGEQYKAVANMSCISKQCGYRSAVTRNIRQLSISHSRQQFLKYCKKTADVLYAVWIYYNITYYNRMLQKPSCFCRPAGKTASLGS